MTRNLKWILLIGALVGAVMCGGWFAWVEVAAHRECVALGEGERALLMFPLAGQVHGYQRKHGRYPATADEALHLLNAGATQRLARAAFYRDGRLVWTVLDGVPQRLRDGRRIICWYSNPRYSYYVAAVVLEENGAPSAQLIEMADLP